MKEYKYKINGNEYTVAVGDINNNVADVTVNGVAYNVELKHVAAAAPAAAPVSKPKAQPAAAAAGEYVVVAPLPGVIKEINVKEGQQVKASDVVCILEAMKMGNEIHAGKDGVVKSITVAKEDSVLEGNSIMIIA